MTPYLSIDELVALRNHLTDRRDEQIDYTAVDQIDAKLAQVPAGQRNDVDLLLGRSEAVLPERPGYFVSQSVTLDSVKPLADAMMEQYGSLMSDSPRDWKDLRGDCDL